LNVEIDLSILIVTFNSGSVLAGCLDSIPAATGEKTEIILVDNASRDGTLALVRRNYPAVRVIANPRNVGFAAAVNQAAQAARGSMLLLLNPDTVVQSGAIDQLVSFLAEHPAAGICAPRVLDRHGRIRHNCFRFETPWTFFWFGVGVGPLQKLRNRILGRTDWQIDRDSAQNVEAVTGAALLVRRQLYEQLGGMDERFFMYCEDGDFCLRARQAGYQAMLVPRSVMTHIGAASTPHGAALLNGMIGRHLLHSRYHYTMKYWGKAAMRTLRLAYGAAGAFFMLAGAMSLDLQRRPLLRRHGKLLWATPLPRLEKHA
jgi:hypothetical protein